MRATVKHLLGVLGRGSKAGIFFLCASTAVAGNYSVSPLNLEFTPQKKSAVITVTNDDKKILNLRVRPTRWLQDAKGVDTYQDTGDLIVFPRQLNIKPSDKKIIRVGINELPQAGENAYRLYIEELAPPQEPKNNQTRLSVLVNIGVPIFASTQKLHPLLQITQLPFSSPKNLEFNIVNAGNMHARIGQIVTADNQIVSQASTVRYIFPGVTRLLTVPLTPALCTGGNKQLKFETDEELLSIETIFPEKC